LLAVAQGGVENDQFIAHENISARSPSPNGAAWAMGVRKMARCLCPSGQQAQRERKQEARIALKRNGEVLRAHGS
jgi:hypothetical protein